MLAINALALRPLRRRAGAAVHGVVPRLRDQAVVHVARQEAVVRLQVVAVAQRAQVRVLHHADEGNLQGRRECCGWYSLVVRVAHVSRQQPGNTSCSADACRFSYYSDGLSVMEVARQCQPDDRAAPWTWACSVWACSVWSWRHCCCQHPCHSWAVPHHDCQATHQLPLAVLGHQRHRALHPALGQRQQRSHLVAWLHLREQALRQGGGW